MKADAPWTSACMKISLSSKNFLTSFSFCCAFLPPIARKPFEVINHLYLEYQFTRLNKGLTCLTLSPLIADSPSLLSKSFLTSSALLNFLSRLESLFLSMLYCITRGFKTFNSTSSPLITMDTVPLLGLKLLTPLHLLTADQPSLLMLS